MNPDEFEQLVLDLDEAMNEKQSKKDACYLPFWA